MNLDLVDGMIYEFGVSKRLPAISEIERCHCDARQKIMEWCGDMWIAMENPPFNQFRNEDGSCRWKPFDLIRGYMGADIRAGFSQITTVRSLQVLQRFLTKRMLLTRHSGQPSGTQRNLRPHPNLLISYQFPHILHLSWSLGRDRSR
jgi:hypothetical protein